MKQFTGIALLAVAAGLAGYFASRWFNPEPSSPPRAFPHATETAVVGEERPLFELPDLSGQTHSIAEWDGKLILLNFWATWCGPCREEMPMLDRLQQQYGGKGLQVVGVALDLPAPVRHFTAELGIDYPILIDDIADSNLMPRYGNSRGVLPYSVLITRDGSIAKMIFGRLHREELVPILLNYL